MPRWAILDLGCEFRIGKWLGQVRFVATSPVAIALHQLPSEPVSNILRARRRSILCAVGLTFLSPALSFGQLNVLMSGGFSPAYQELLPEFEKTTGITITTMRGPSQGDGPNTIGAQLQRGVQADVVIMNREGLERLILDGRVIAGTAVDLARVPLGLAVRHGAEKPEIGTVAAFRQALLSAKSISSDSSARIYIIKEMLPQLGIADAVEPKLMNEGASAVASGRSDFVILPVSELLHAPGVDFADTIPAEIQHVSVFSAALVSGSKRQDAAKRLITFMRSEAASAAIRKSGMEPSRP
jgi:molybdate transport system substrate-binding protein